MQKKIKFKQQELKKFNMQTQKGGLKKKGKNVMKLQ